MGKDKVKKRRGKILKGRKRKGEMQGKKQRQKERSGMILKVRKKEGRKEGKRKG